jgi:hypothetical protein
MTARRHHYVPCCYLKGFAVARKKGKHQIQVYDREKRETYETAIENVAVERDFNRVDIDGVASDALESGLGSFEGTMAPALERTLAAAAFQNEDDRAYVLNLVALLALRNPRWREQMRKFRERIARQLMDMTLATEERWRHQMEKARRDGFLDGLNEVTYEEMKRFQNEKFRIEVSTDAHIQQEMKNVDTILPFLFERKWMFLKAPKNSGGFITCDHPVLLTWSNPARRGGSYPPGYGVGGTDVMVPLSSRLAMVGAFEIENGSREISEEGVGGFNGAAVVSAMRHVYARDRNFLYGLDTKEACRKASRLIDDQRFVRRSAKEEGNAANEADEAEWETG